MRAYEWVDLGRPDRLVDPVAVGRLLAAIHAVGFDGTNPVEAWYTEPVGALRWRELATAMVAARGPYADALAELCDELIALEGWIVPPRELMTCHRDLWADNVLATPSGDVYVIDWDCCGLADPNHEVALVLCEFGADEAERAQAVYRSYVDAGGPGRVTRREDFSMVIAQISHIGEAALATWLDPGTPAAERDRQVPRIEEFVTLAVTREVIDGVLAAVAGA